MPTYTPLQSIQLASSSASVTFSGIPQIYQDLVLVISATSVAGGGEDLRLQINGDTGSNYSATWFDSHYNSSPTSGRLTNRSNFQLTNYVGVAANEPTASTVHFLNYSNTSTFKTMLARHTQIQGTSYYDTMSLINLWRSTSAINNINIYLSASAFSAGSTFDIYGISPVAAQTAQAAGGTDIYYDSSYVYHVFKGSGTFTPYRNLTAEVLAIAGGGGGGGARNGDAGSGGGGAGGLLYHSSKSLTSGTSYTVTIGAGGIGGVNDLSNYTAGGSGTNSVFDTMTANGGGGGGNSRGNGSSGGSGGGSGSESGISGGSATQGNSGGATGYGNAGGTGTGTGNAGGAGGGGAGAAGGSGVSSTSAGAGGVGLTNSTINTLNAFGSATSTGELSGGNYYYAGGGSGGSYSTRTLPNGGLGGGGKGGNATGSIVAESGDTNTGGGGGGSGDGSPGGGGRGGSGLVIVRYAR